jgi:hypothetical protein
VNARTGTVLAKLVGRSWSNRLTTLTLWPAAYEDPLLEHIVLTALIVERSRLTEAAFSRFNSKPSWAA